MDTVALYSLSRPELRGRPSAFDIVTDPGRTVIIEAAGYGLQWDIALVEDSGSFYFLPLGAVEGLTTTAALDPTSDDFDAVRSASRDSADYIGDAPVPVVTGQTYVLRSRNNPLLSGCYYFAKLQPFDIDEADGVVRMFYTRDPYCNNRALVPPGS